MLELLGTVAAKRFAPWGFDDTDGRRITGVVLRHYFDSRQAQGATLLSGTSSTVASSVQILGVVPHSGAPKIIRE